MVISEMNVKLTASTSGFARAMDKAGGHVKKFRKGAGKVGAALGSMASGVGIAAAGIAAVAWPTKMIFDLGSSIEETGSKFATVFGPEASAQVTSFLEGFANKAGMTMNEAKGLVSTTGAIAQGLGFSQKESAKFSTEITSLAGDLSSFNNIPTEQVLMGINSALTGEREQMKQLGIVVTEADVQARAFANTGKDVAKTLTQQEKATATLQIITEKAGVAVGDLDRTSGSAANVFRRLVARFKEIRDAISTALMPAFREVLGQVEESEGKFQEFRQTILDNAGAISAWAIVGVEAFKVVVEVIKGAVRLVKNMGDQMVVMWKLFKSIVTLNWDGITDAVLEGWENIKDVGEAVNDIWDSGADLVGAITDAVTGAKNEYYKLGDAVNDVEIPTTLPDSVDGVGTRVENLTEKVQKLGESITKNFADRMIDAVQGGKEAFAGFFTWLKNKLIEMAIKFLLFKAIIGIGGEKLGDFATGLTGFKLPDTATGGEAVSAKNLITSGTRPQSIRSRMVVNQSINFTVSAIDARDATRFIREQGGTIAEIISTAARDSTTYRRQLQGT